MIKKIVVAALVLPLSGCVAGLQPSPTQLQAQQSALDRAARQRDVLACVTTTIDHVASGFDKSVLTKDLYEAIAAQCNKASGLSYDK